MLKTYVSMRRLSIFQGVSVRNQHIPQRSLIVIVVFIKTEPLKGESVRKPPKPPFDEWQETVGRADNQRNAFGFGKLKLRPELIHKEH